MNTPPLSRKKAYSARDGFVSNLLRKVIRRYQIIVLHQCFVCIEVDYYEKVPILCLRTEYVSLLDKKDVEIATWLILPVAYACLKD